MTTYSPQELVTMMIAEGKNLEEAHAELVRCVRAEAEADRKYRLAKSNAYLATSGTVGEREAHVDKTVADERYAAHLAEGLAKSALEAVRNHRQRLSALQSIANSVKAEAELARTGP